MIPTASLAGTEVSVDEIRSAAAYSNPYPPSLHAALLSSPEPFYPSGNLNIDTFIFPSNCSFDCREINCRIVCLCQSIPYYYCS